MTLTESVHQAKFLKEPFYRFQVITTILDTDTQVVTATEIKTSSILMTPEPTWSIETLTITPTPQLTQPQLIPTTVQPLLLPQPFRSNLAPRSILTPKKRRTNSNVRAQVVEIDEKTSPRKDDFKAAYGAFFASSAQRSAERFKDIIRPARNTNNPLFGNQDNDFDYYDFDQQFLAAQNEPVFLPSPARKSKVFTLYFSGTLPGEFTTKLTRLPVDDSGQPILSRNKREEINPSKVEPIESTAPPSDFFELDSVVGSDFVTEIDGLIDTLSDLESSIVTVTVTHSVTETVPCSPLLP